MTRLGEPIQFSPLIDSLTVSVVPTTLELTYAHLLASICIGFFLFVGLLVGSDQDDYAGAGAKATGVLSLCLYFLTAILSTKWGMALTFLIDLPFERALKFHRMSGRFLAFFSGVHLLAVIDFWGSAIVTSSKLTGYRSVVPVYGFLAFLTLILMGAMAAPAIRRAYYEVFLYSHWFGFLMMSIFVMVHLKETSLYWIVLFAWAIHTADFVIKTYAMYYPVGQTHPNPSGRQAHDPHNAVDAEVVGEVTVLSLHLPKALFRRGVGDYAFLNIPEISKTEWHPFTITSNPNKSNSFPVTFHIKNMGAGTWTGALHQMASANDVFTVCIDGPCGSLSMTPQDCKSVLLVAGGIGITPFASILEDLLERESPLVSFIWVIRTVELTEPFRDLLTRAQDSDKVSIEIYVTKHPAYSDALDVARSSFPGIIFKEGRPNMLVAVDNMNKTTGDNTNEVGVYACGPAPLVAAVEKQAYSRGNLFHKEVFHF